MGFVLNCPWRKLTLAQLPDSRWTDSPRVSPTMSRLAGLTTPSIIGRSMAISQNWKKPCLLLFLSIVRLPSPAIQPAVASLAGHPRVAPMGWGNRCFPSSQSGIPCPFGWGGGDRVPHEGRPETRIERHDGPFSLLSHSPAPANPKTWSRTTPNRPVATTTPIHASMRVDRDRATRIGAEDRTGRDAERFLEHCEPSSRIFNEAMQAPSY